MAQATQRGRFAAGLVSALVGLAVAGGVWWWLGGADRRAGPYAERADWSAPSRKGVHYSVFTFRDRDRDGRLADGDLPMAWVAVEMTSPRSGTAVARSNGTGFANFDLSTWRWWRAGIHAPGEYRFRALVPPGWVVTSGNAEQRCRFVRLPGSPADLIAENPGQPIGLAPELSIAGRLLGPGAAAASLEARGPDGAARPVALGLDASFVVPATPGRWRFAARWGSGAALEREVVVRDAPVRLAGIVVDEAPLAAAGRELTVDFESISGAWTAKIPSGIAGLAWDSLNAIEAVEGKGEGYANTLASGHYVAYSSSGHPVTLSRPGGFDFVGGYFGVAWGQAEGETLRVEARRAGRVVAEERLRLSSLGPVWFDADYRDVDEVRLQTLRYWQFVVDDLMVRLPLEP